MSALLALAFCVAGPSSSRVPVILTTDCGVEVDDQWALAHLATSSRIELLGVVTTHAPGLEAPAAESTAKAARGVLEGLPLVRKPTMVAGSSKPLVDRRTALPNRGVDFLLRESRRDPNGRRVVVLVIGAATDVASAVLLDPTFCDRVEVVAMGFDRWPEGGDPWNVKNDVRAWQVLLDSKVPIVVGDGDVGKRCLVMSTEKARRRLGASGAAGRMLIETLDSWLKLHPGLAAKTSGSPKEWPIWDVVTVAYLLGLAESEERPRPTLRDDLTFDHSRPRGTVTWIKSVNSDALWNDLAACLRSSP